MEKLEKAIFEIQSEERFKELALEVYHFQYNNCHVYQNFVDSLNRPIPDSLQNIPFLPISFFKTHEVKSNQKKTEIVFKSSGTTTNQRSKHCIQSPLMYENSFLKTYENQIGNPKNQIILALLPNYLEQGDSSLVYMVKRLIEESQNELSGFFLSDFDSLIQNYERGILLGKKVVLFGVSYALLDLALLKPQLTKAIIIETGGMKGKRKEMSKESLHKLLKSAFKVPFISSEYGMTELLSQGYLNENGVFENPNWMKILIRETNDPFSYVSEGKTGGINVIDLANLYSCSFISTQDLGKISKNGFQLMGRFDNSDIRGCNLLID
jgi:hypothetical protein